MRLDAIFNVILSAALPFPVAVFWRYATRRWRRPFNLYVSWASSGVGGLIANATGGLWLAAAASALNVIAAVVLWWLSRRRRKRAPKLAGAKSRALLAAVVAKLRESLKPRPVLRPVPGGAR